ncbi:MAG TPA: dienelactone hydrolase family protein [Acidimicrobiia bacterium]|jgi:carboxymethylenebutenolidase
MAALAEGLHETELERRTITGADGAAVEFIHARTAGMPVRGVVVHPDIMGVRPLFDDLCRRLASHGLAVAAAEPFARVADRASLEPAQRMERVAQLDDDLQLGDLERAANFLVVEDGVTDVAVLGFCMGGMYSLKAAATGRFDRAVAFYGMIRVPKGWRGPHLHEPLESAQDVCPTLAFFGGSDAFTPKEDIDALRDAWSDRPDCEIVVYDEAEHGFVHDADRQAHRADDAADAWRRTLVFLSAD